MLYPYVTIADNFIPRATNPLFQHLLDTYVSESNKVVAIWRALSDADLGFAPDSKSRTVLEILQHQLLSERRFFGEFLGTVEPPAGKVLPALPDLAGFQSRFAELVRDRLDFFAARTDAWWLETVPFFDVQRQRVWIFWRRVLHTAHHRTQLAVYLRLLNKPVPAIYGPTADLSWDGADPTDTLDAASRK